ncbi:MAG TPA: MBL fold metallo-hydrolase [Arachidicoccus sp.]|nr:MBL fold metallo-hydrolase [Arachidicoccus sp.]
MFSIETFTFNPFQENSYVLHNTKGEAVIVDPGTYYPAEQQKLKEYILRAGLTPTLLINTHCHLDHVFGNKWIAETYGLTPQIQPLEEEMHRMADIFATQYGLPFDSYNGIFTYLNEGDKLQLGEDRLEILLTPGHSPGSLSFYCPDQGFILSGDALFRDSIGRTDLPKGNPAQLLQSIKEKLFTLPPETVVYPGHGPKTTIGYEIQHNPFIQ